MKTSVEILISCRGPEHIPMSTLVFDSLRTGFPDANVFVTINGGPKMDAAASEHILDELEQDGFQNAWPLSSEVEHGEWMADAMERHDGPVVFVDTDVIFWANCEDLPRRVADAGKLYGGRFIPWTRMAAGLSSPPRIHPSLFVVPDPKALLKELAPINERLWYFRPFEGYTTVNAAGEALCWDTCASLFSALPKAAYGFGENELDRYDHLFAGTYPDRFERMLMRPEFVRAFTRAHEVAKTNPAALRGIWRAQESDNPQT